MLRNWEADFLIEGWLALEVQGGVWMDESGHASGSGIERDMRKLSDFLIEGFILIQVDPKKIKDGTILEDIETIYGMWINRAPKSLSGGL